MEACFSQIRNHPQYYTSINEKYRRLKVYRFPYLIIYETEDETVVINSVWHTSRKPKID
ncbi:MAG: type II toxin-antitoxin system RelE/ParE family toxin [Pseudobacter sp.]|uniref:type II toxin-antitoxin system RelE/ParE family toxin n=1 Tax=Pseudobacter sp. TaxID=2045420 RepID=UPI003F803E65